MHRRSGKTALDIPDEVPSDIVLDCLIPEVLVREQAFTNEIQRDIVPHIHAALNEMAQLDPLPVNPFDFLKAKLGFVPARDAELEEVRNQLELESLRHDALLSQVIRLRAKITIMEEELRAREAAAAAIPAPPLEPQSPLRFNPDFEEQWDRFFVPK